MVSRPSAWSKPNGLLVSLIRALLRDNSFSRSNGYGAGQLLVFRSLNDDVLVVLLVHVADRSPDCSCGERDVAAVRQHLDELVRLRLCPIAPSAEPPLNAV